MAFFGKKTVFADLRLHKKQAGLVTTGTLKLRTSADTFSDVTYTNVCLWPVTKTSSLGTGGLSAVRTRLTAWRVGEASAPTVDSKWVVGGVSYLIVSLTSRHNHDESSGYAIYDCDVTRAG